LARDAALINVLAGFGYIVAVAVAVAVSLDIDQLDLRRRSLADGVCAHVTGISCGAKVVKNRVSLE
jgi:hypothetical protein